MLLTSLDPLSNTASWTDTLTLYENGEPIYFGHAQEVELIIRDQRDCHGNEIKATLTGGGITMADDGMSAVFHFDKSQMHRLCARTYTIGVRLVFTDETDEVQALLGNLPILNGT